jgi:hypothetical protein
MHDVDGINTGLVQALYEEYLESPHRLPAVWREYFSNGASSVAAPRDAPGEPEELPPAAVAAAMSLVMAHRTHGT